MTSPERVVIVNDRSEAKGGASGLALLSARLLAGRGVPVTYVTGDGGSESLTGTADVVAIGGAALLERGRLAALTSGLYSRAAYAAMAGWIGRHDTPGTVYHLHGWSKILSPAVLRALAPIDDRLVLHAHDFFLACPNGAFMHYARGRPCGLRPMSAACATTNCDKRSYAQKLWRTARQGVREAVFDLRQRPSDILLIHPGMASYFERYGIARERLHPVRNPVEPMAGPPVDAAANEAVFFVGRLEEEKGVEDLAQAARQAGVPLEIAGDGPLRESLVRRFPEARFHGWLDRDALARVIRGARLVALPTRYPEPFGLVAVEALSHGIPVLASDTALLSGEIVAHGMGARFRATDVEDCAAALRRLAADDAAIACMAAQARTHAAGLASTPAQWCDALLARYAAALERGHRVASPGLVPRSSPTGQG